MPDYGVVLSRSQICAAAAAGFANPAFAAFCERGGGFLERGFGDVGPAGGRVGAGCA